MKVTSHFIGIGLNPEILSDVFIEVYRYLKEKKILDSIVMQNPLSPHITLYYLEKNLSNEDSQYIKDDISRMDVSQDIHLTGIDYFFRENNRFILYFTTDTKLPLKTYRDNLHKKYSRVEVEDNKLNFSPHITFLRILNSGVYELHRNNIERIIKDELSKLKGLNISTQNIYLYKVNSNFPGQIQIKF